MDEADVPDVYTGGCLCGQIRYQIQGAPFAADYCHCASCQKTSGAPVVAWADFATEQLRWTALSQPKTYASSARVRRGFCEACGSTLTFQHLDYPEYITVAIGSLDVPDQVSPTYHIYVSNQRKWFELKDTLPRFQYEQK